MAIVLLLVGALGLAAGVVGWLASGRSAPGLIAMAIGALAFVAAVLLAWGLLQASSNIDALIRRARLFADGDLLAPVPSSRTRELGALGRALAGAVEMTEKALRQVRAALGEIGAASGQLLKSTEQYAAGSQQQAAAVGEIAHTMERLSDAARQIAGGSSRANAAAAEGRVAVEATASGVAAIRDAVDTAVERGASLRVGSERVGEVADGISGIAERTHILALNAAIEATAAGEYGRRFAVVAGQVRELAADTRRATAQVKSTVQELREAVAALEASGEQARGVALRVDEQAQRAVQAIAEVLGIVDQIARATGSQHSATVELVKTMRDMVEVAQQSAASSQSSADEAARLNAAAARLETVVARFRLAASS